MCCDDENWGERQKIVRALREGVQGGQRGSEVQSREEGRGPVLVGLGKPGSVGHGDRGSSRVGYSGRAEEAASALPAPSLRF